MAKKTSKTSKARGASPRQKASVPALISALAADENMRAVAAELRRPNGEDVLAYASTADLHNRRTIIEELTRRVTMTVTAGDVAAIGVVLERVSYRLENAKLTVDLAALDVLP